MKENGEVMPDPEWWEYPADAERRAQK